MRLLRGEAFLLCFRDEAEGVGEAVEALVVAGVWRFVLRQTGVGEATVIADAALPEVEMGKGLAVVSEVGPVETLVV